MQLKLKDKFTYTAHTGCLGTEDNSLESIDAGVEKENAETVRRACPDVEYYLNVDVEKPDKQTVEYVSALVEEVKTCGAIGVNFNKDNATPELVEAFHENGLLVSI